MASLIRGFADRMPGREIRAVTNKIDLVPPSAEPPVADFDVAPILATSAKSGQGVRQLFDGLAAAILRRGF